MADPYNPNPFATQSGVSTNSFEDWYNQYYGGNTSGYQPQKRLSDLAYQQPQPRQFSYTNADFSPPPQQQMYQAPVQSAPVQQSYQQPAYDNTRVSGVYYTNYNGNLIPTSDYVRMENARVRGGGSSYD